MNIPYGVRSFGRVRNKQHLYVDRTGLIPVLDAGPAHLLLCRPRGFGKTLALSMLSRFHDRQLAGYFDLLFAGLQVAREHPASMGSNLILRLEVNAATRADRDRQVVDACHACRRRYRHLLPEGDGPETPRGALTALLETLAPVGPVCLLAEDARHLPDYFAADDFAPFARVVACSDWPEVTVPGLIDRSHDPALAGAFGFTREETADLLDRVGLVPRRQLHADMVTFFGGYRWADGPELLCPALVMHFLKTVFDSRRYPRHMNPHDRLQREDTLATDLELATELALRSAAPAPAATVAPWRAEGLLVPGDAPGHWRLPNECARKIFARQLHRAWFGARREPAAAALQGLVRDADAAGLFALFAGAAAAGRDLAGLAVAAVNVGDFYLWRGEPMAGGWWRLLLIRDPRRELPLTEWIIDLHGRDAPSPTDAELDERLRLPLDTAACGFRGLRLRRAVCALDADGRVRQRQGEV